MSSWSLATGACGAHESVRRRTVVVEPARASWTSETSEKTKHVNYTFCDQVFGEMELDGQDIGLGATQIFVSFKL